MKKLKLYGEKKLFWGIKRKGIVAEIYVGGKDENLTVESKYPEVKKDLADALDHLVKSGELLLKKGVGIGEEHATIGVSQKPGDALFLEALKSYGPFWWGKKFGGWEINELLSVIVTE